MFVPKTPLRYDFCGCPPCGLCFDWVEPNPPDEPPPEEEVRVDGLVKMAQDLTGKEEVTEEEVNQVKDYCLEKHARIISDGLNPKPPPEEGALFEEEDRMWLGKAITEKRLAKEKEKAYNDKMANRKPTLDELNWGEEERKKEQEEELKKQAEEEQKKERLKKNQYLNKPSPEEQRRREKEAYERLRAQVERTPYYDPITGRYY